MIWNILSFEFKVTTSSQRDQDDENILIVDSESDEEMPDDGPVEPDDTIRFEDDGDNVEPFEETQGKYYLQRNNLKQAESRS